MISSLLGVLTLIFIEQKDCTEGMFWDALGTEITFRYAAFDHDSRTLTRNEDSQASNRTARLKLGYGHEKFCRHGSTTSRKSCTRAQSFPVCYGKSSTLRENAPDLFALPHSPISFW